MNVVQLVLAKKPGATEQLGPQYPQRPPDEILREEMLALREITYAAVLEEGGEQKLAELESQAAHLTNDHGFALCAAIRHELRQATVSQIEKLMFMLIDSRRDSRDLSVTFGEIAVSRVSSLQPSFGALQAAVKRLIDEPRAEFKAKMEISDILETVKDEQQLRERALKWIVSVPKQVASWRAKIDA